MTTTDLRARDMNDDDRSIELRYPCTLHWLICGGTGAGLHTAIGAQIYDDETRLSFALSYVIVTAIVHILATSAGYSKRTAIRATVAFGLAYALAEVAAYALALPKE